MKKIRSLFYFLQTIDLTDKIYIRYMMNSLTNTSRGVSENPDDQRVAQKNKKYLLWKKWKKVQL